MTITTFAPEFTYNDATKRLSVPNILQILSTTTVDLQVTTGQILYTVPTGKRLILTNIVGHTFTTGLSVEFRIGYNSPSYNNIGTYGPPGAPMTTSQYVLAAISDRPPQGLPSDTLNLIMTSTNATPGTMKVDVIGYLVDT